MYIKHEWRKKEKEIYLPKNKPELLTIPEYNYITISGEGNPNSPEFLECISVLYSVSYAIKMNLKKIATPPSNYQDYTVYPLEGVWDINEEAKKHFSGKINKDDLVFELMIRQPHFVEKDFYQQMLTTTKQRKPHALLEDLKFKKINEGRCVQMLHIGSYDKEAESFAQMEEFAKYQNLIRKSKIHKEVYLSDFRRVPEEKLKTILRFKVHKIKKTTS